MKYIVMQVKKSDDFTIEIPFVFPEIIVHDMMATVCKVLLEEQFQEALEIKPVSGGFISSMAFGDECYGESQTLKLKSRGILDSHLLATCDYGSMYT